MSLPTNSRPNKQDLDALAILLNNDDAMSDGESEFLESLRNWRGAWTVKQLDWFDAIWDKYEGRPCFDD